MSTTVSMKMRLYALPIDEGKNFVLESLASNLDSMAIAKFPASSYLTTTAPANIELETSVRVALPDDVAFTLSLYYTYCRMAYTGSDHVQRDYFYFIKDITREGNNVLRLALRLDCLNTFYHLWRHAFSDKTRIIRQHEDRFLSGASIAPAVLLEKVDPIGEGINPPLYVISRRSIKQDYYDSRWCLRYEKDLEPEGITDPVTTESMIQVLLPQQEGNTIPYRFSRHYPSILDDFSGLNIRTSENPKYSPRKSTKLVKEIQCPYCPFPIIAGHHSSVEPSLDYDAIAIDGMDGEYTANEWCFPFTDHYDNTMSSKVCVDTVLNLTTGGVPQANQARYKEDPKLLSSEFHSFTYVYDIYEWAPQIELVTPALYGSSLAPTIWKVEYGITYHQSADFSGNLAFRFALNDGTYPGTLRGVEDYEGLLTCNRNNDHVLFYDSYYEYMRLGYNYDRKTAISSDVGAWTAFGTGVVGTVLAFATQNYAVGIAAAVGTVAGLINAIKTTVDNENSLNRKQEEARRKGTNPQNVGDASLLYSYNENKLWMMEKSVSPFMSKMVDDLFYYYGYARGYYGKPNLTSRLYFNFIQCEAVFNNIVIPRFAMTDITAKLSEGVTVFHSVGGDYNTAQTFENWETSLM